ncbi:hypothetical protein L6164_023711 [Bauhinia variegata]|uniref:Uncharacterized protein n=1 Tax=Bauhinia variegata TaxID=167791 RepID=A0ACB9MJM3_BAUVA|nr:hypothetical protein L6164_023711 [Bauhinia variegata]
MSERMRNGRRKIEIKKISRKSNLQASFSKRRYGFFEKASELSTLCGAEVAVIAFSPGDKVFSLGYPCVDSVLENFNQFPNQSNATIQQIQHDAMPMPMLTYITSMHKSLKLMTSLIKRISMGKNSKEP